MNLVVAGKTNKEIATDLELSIRAIEDRRARMMKRLGVKSRAELLELAVAGQFSLNAPYAPLAVLSLAEVAEPIK